ncbi:hypothetical protein M434DRAFT_19246 [Hypoxylon sp. CO27-5]|nr:hypothetical protein M434DRAFT_19246 [Hypoxylon sp. CO27-5]
MLRVTLFGSQNRASTSVSFEPERDIPSLTGKVILITGAAGDLGRQTAIELARYGRPAHIYVADLPRDERSKTALIDRITSEAYGDNDDSADTRTMIHFLDLDLTSFRSVRACAADFLSQEDRLDILILNAGIIRVATGLTSEGYEIHFGLNYLGHALLSRLLMPAIELSAPLNSEARIVVVSSEGHAMAPKEGIKFENLKTTCSDMSYGQRYGQSKLALIGLMRGLAHRYPKVKSCAVHPGRILTGMAESLKRESILVRVTTPISPLFCVPVSVGIRNHLWAATSLDIVSGTYYEPVGVPAKGSTAAQDEKMPDKLWEWTTNELKGRDILVG